MNYVDLQIKQERSDNEKTREFRFFLRTKKFIFRTVDNLEKRLKNEYAKMLGMRE